MIASIRNWTSARSVMNNPGWVPRLSFSLYLFALPLKGYVQRVHPQGRLPLYGPENTRRQNLRVRSAEIGGNCSKQWTTDQSSRRSLRGMSTFLAGFRLVLVDKLAAVDGGVFRPHCEYWDKESFTWHTVSGRGETTIRLLGTPHSVRLQPTDGYEENRWRISEDLLGRSVRNTIKRG